LKSGTMMESPAAARGLPAAGDFALIGSPAMADLSRAYSNNPTI